MSKEFSGGAEAIDVESRVISVEAEEQSGAEAVVTPAPLSLEKSLVPAFEASKEIAKADVAIAAARAVVKEVEDAKVDEIDVSTEDGEKKVRALLKRVVKQRTGTQTAYETWNRPLLDAQKGVRKVVKQVEDIVQPAEDKLSAIVKGIDDAREMERQREIEREQDRIRALRDKITAIPGVLLPAVSMTSAQIETELRALQDMVITSDETSFGEFSDEAAALRASAVSKLLEMFNAKKAAEDEAVRLVAERKAALERERLAEVERGLRLRISALQQLAFSAIGQPAAKIKTILDELIAREPLALDFGDLSKEAVDTWGMAKVMLENAYAGQKRMEEQQAHQARVAEEQAALSRRIEEEERQRQALADAELARQQEAAKPVVAECQTYSDHMAPVELVLEASPAGRQAVAGLGADFDRMVAETTRISEGLLELASGAECTKDVDPQVIEAKLYEDAAVEVGLMDPPEPTMSQFADRSALEEARGLFLAKKVTDDSSVHSVALAIVDTLSFADYPLPEVGELTIVSLLLNPEVQGALRIYQESLINATESNA